MTIRLAVKNMKRSIVSDIVYFVTLTLGVSLIYTFYAMTDQTMTNPVVSDNWMLTGPWWLYMLDYVFSAIGVIISAVLAFLVVYANNFLMKRRKKEIGIYMVLGMDRRRLAGVLLVETAFVGIISLIAGILTGIVLAQGLSMFAASLFEADMSEFVFEISGVALRKTMLHFLLIYVAVFILNLVVVGKAKLIWLLNAGRKPERNTVKNPWVCLVVFLAAAVLLGRVYYTVTVKLDTLISPETVYYQFGALTLATFMIFWSLSGLLLFLARFRKRFYFKGIHVFTAREIGSRVNTNTAAGGIMSFLMFLAISIFLVCFSASLRMNENLKTFAPVDMELEYWHDPDWDFEHSVGGIGASMEELVQKADIDTAMFQDAVDITIYEYRDVEDGSFGSKENVFTNVGEIIGISDYNKLAQMYGMEKHTLAEDEYFVVANYPSIIRWYNNSFLSKNHVITLDGKAYHPKYKECQDGILRMDYVAENLGYTVVPDQALSGENMIPDRGHYLANYNAGSEGEAKRVDAYVKSEAFWEKLYPGIQPEERSAGGIYKSDIYRQSIGTTSAIIFFGFYVSIMFFIAGASLFSLKELSQAVDNREKYTILAKIGVDQKMIRRSLFCQNAIFFGMPLLLAVLHSVFGIQGLVALTLGFTDLFVESEIWHAMWLAGVMLLGVYVMYFVITYRCGRKIIEERND